MQNCRRVWRVDHQTVRCQERRTTYLPSAANTTDLGIRGDHHLPQVSGVPQIFDARPLLLVQPQID